MELRSGRLLMPVMPSIQTVFKHSEDKKKYLCKIISDLMNECESARGMELKIFYATHIYKIMLVHKEYIWTNPAFKKFKVAATEKAEYLITEINEKVTIGRLSSKSTAYKEAIQILTLFCQELELEVEPELEPELEREREPEQS